MIDELTKWICFDCGNYYEPYTLCNSCMVRRIKYRIAQKRIDYKKKGISLECDKKRARKAFKTRVVNLARKGRMKEFYKLYNSLRSRAVYRAAAVKRDLNKLGIKIQD